jgi:predicted nucleic acid-binding protein
MGNEIFVDTNILIHLLDGKESLVPLLENKGIHVSFVTEMELLSKNNITRADIKNINLVLDACKLYDFNDKIKSSAIILMRNYRLKLADAIIAATANYYGLELITGDGKFKNIPGCTIIEI